MHYHFNMRNSIIVFAVLLIAAIAAVAIYTVVGKPSVNTLPALSVTPTPTATLSAEVDVSPITTPPDISLLDELKAGGSSYSDPNSTYTFLYPSDYKLDTQGQVRIYKTGPTQKGQTEIYDGIIMSFEPITLNGQSLSAWVDARIKSLTTDGTSEVIEPKQSITVSGYPGYRFTMRGLGTYTYTVLQKNGTSSYAVGVTTMVSDPQQVGFQKQADAILASLQLMQ